MKHFTILLTSLLLTTIITYQESLSMGIVLGFLYFASLHYVTKSESPYLPIKKGRL